MPDPLHTVLLASSLTPDPSVQHRLERAKEEQVPEAIELIRRENRPVSVGFLKVNLRYALFGSTTKALKAHPNIKLSRHKGKLYYTYKGDRA